MCGAWEFIIFIVRIMIKRNFFIKKCPSNKGSSSFKLCKLPFCRFVHSLHENENITM